MACCRKTSCFACLLGCALHSLRTNQVLSAKMGLGLPCLCWQARHSSPDLGPIQGGLKRHSCLGTCSSTTQTVCRLARITKQGLPNDAVLLGAQTSVAEDMEWSTGDPHPSPRPWAYIPLFLREAQNVLHGVSGASQASYEDWRGRASRLQHSTL